MSSPRDIRAFAQEHGCSDGVALKVLTLQKQRAELIEALQGIALRHRHDNSPCFDGCDKAGLHEPSPFCAHYQALLRRIGEAP